jgi:hypothetical protein
MKAKKPRKTGKASNRKGRRRADLSPSRAASHFPVRLTGRVGWISEDSFDLRDIKEGVFRSESEIAFDCGDPGYPFVYTVILRRTQSASCRAYSKAFAFSCSCSRPLVARFAP